MINQQLITRNNLIVTGLVGLFGAMLLMALCIIIVAQGWFPILLASSSLVWGLFLFLAVLSIAEIPVMIFGMRRILAEANPKAEYVILFTNAAYTFFAAAYAAPFILLTGGIWPGLALAGLTLARFASSITFLPQGK